jgi:hypothetical protein
MSDKVVVIKMESAELNLRRKDYERKCREAKVTKPLGLVGLVTASGKFATSGL